MKVLEVLLEDARIPEFCFRNGIARLSLFGSAQRGEDRTDSDLDLLVEFHESAIVSLIDLSRMQDELSEMLGRQVDLRTPAELSRYFRDEIERTAATLYAA